MPPEELAARLGVTTDTLRTWEKKGAIPRPRQVLNSTATGRGRGRRWVRYDYHRVLRWLDGKRDD